MRLNLGQAAQVTLGRQRAPQFESGDHVVPYLRSANVVDGALDLTDVKEMNFTPVEQAIFSLEPGDVLVTEGSGSRETVGTSAVYQGEIPGAACFQNTLLRLRPRAGVTDGRFLAWWMRHARTSGLVAAVSTGANILHIGSDGLKRLSIDVPTLAEQRRIADFLDERVALIDQIIAARLRELDLGRAVTKSRLVSQVIQPVDQLTRCGAVAEVRLGRQRSPQNAEGPHMVRYLRSANVTDGALLLADVMEMNFSPSEQVVFSLRAGDVLVSEGSASMDAVGAAVAWKAELPGTVCFQNTLLRLRAHPGTDPSYLELWARASHAAGAPRAFASGSTILHLGAEGMAKMPFPRIGLQDQQIRAARARELLERNEAGMRGMRCQIHWLQQYKQSLITAAVTGEFDVTTASTRIPENLT